jgi:hypothetical protein
VQQARRRKHSRATKSLDFPGRGRGALDWAEKRSSACTLSSQQQHHQQYLYLALAHLPHAVTLINSSAQILWQNGK